jgi:uncharacterized protein YbaA (DUF1428 family)
MAADGKKAWLKFGALNYKECMSDDVKTDVGDNQGIPFPKLTNAGKNDAVWFSYIEFKNKKHRDAVNKKVMKYFEETYGDEMMKDMPFDMNRFSYGGFKVMVG